MKHWQRHIDKNSRYDQYATSAPHPFDMAVVIPCFNEYNLSATLHSIMHCSPTRGNVWVIIVVNSSETTSPAIVQQNRATYHEVVHFAQQYNCSKLFFTPLWCSNLPKKHAGVGLARRIGMECVLRGFFKQQKSQGIIISLDADCTVSKNYLCSIEQQFAQHHPACCVVNFKHRVASSVHEGNTHTLKQAIDQYEQYIRYYRHALKAIGFPYYYHTIGSAFAVSADAYVRVGGIGRQQAGEDFYFLQKLFEYGTTHELHRTYVYPEARFSDRIPFGTGPSLEKIIEEEGGVLRVYSPHAFVALQGLFALVVQFYKQSLPTIKELIEQLHPSITAYLKEHRLHTAIEESNKNSSTLHTFTKRFFHHFNAFFIIKYLNYAHPLHFTLEPVEHVCDKIEALL